MVGRAPQPACDEGEDWAAKGRQMAMNPGRAGVDSAQLRNYCKELPHE